MSPPHWQGVIIDTHIYQVFSVAVRFKPRFFFASWLTFRQYAVGQSNDQCGTHLVGLQHWIIAPIF